MQKNIPVMTKLSEVYPEDKEKTEARTLKKQTATFRKE